MLVIKSRLAHHIDILGLSLINKDALPIPCLLRVHAQPQHIFVLDHHLIPRLVRPIAIFVFLKVKAAAGRFGGTVQAAKLVHS